MGYKTLYELIGDSKWKIITWKKKEKEKHLVLINPKIFISQSDMINETVKHIRERTTSIIAYGTRENLFGILCSIQALHSRKKLLLAKVQGMNAREMDRLSICPVIANIPLLECV